MTQPNATVNAPSVLVINSGSSTIKYQLFALASDTVLLKGLIDGVGHEQGSHHYQWLDGLGQRHENEVILGQLDFDRGFTALTKVLSDIQATPTAIGHRVVHGGEQFSQATLIDETVVTAIEQLAILAPLHNPANAQGIRICLALFPALPQVAVFDTAFHLTMPDYAYRYPVPESWYQDYGVRRYGFHGTSHYYVAQQAATYLDKPLSELNLISLHLGNGASAAAIQQGQCIDTSMGFTPLEGLMMGTRSGDIDPALTLYIEQSANMTTDEVNETLNHHSGLKGISGESDMRKILQAKASGDKKSNLAVQMYCYRIKKYIGAYIAVLGSIDAILFTGGIGENSALIRQQSCDKMDTLGIKIDTKLNSKPVSVDVSAIHSASDSLPLLVIKTDEERQIAHQVGAESNIVW